MFPFVNRAYDAFLDWLFSHTQSRRYRLSQRLLKLEGVIKERRKIAWRWESDPAFKRRVIQMFGSEMHELMKRYPDFTARVNRVFKDRGHWTIVRKEDFRPGDLEGL